LQGDQPIPPERAPTLAETASRVREQEVFGCFFTNQYTKNALIVNMFGDSITV
jgi:hypothetical protein